MCICVCSERGRDEGDEGEDGGEDERERDINHLSNKR